jgi:hypothetical protein
MGCEVREDVPGKGHARDELQLLRFFTRNLFTQILDMRRFYQRIYSWLPRKWCVSESFRWTRVDEEKFKKAI